MRHRWLATLVPALALAAAPARLAAQESVLVDKIAAIVGDRIVLLSEIDVEINQRRGSGLQVPEDSAALAALRREVLAAIIDDEVLYQAARRDTSITVSDQEVQGAVEDQVRQVRSQFRTEAEYRAGLQNSPFGSPEEYRRWVTEQQRRAAYQQRYLGRLQQEGKLRAGTVSEADLRQAYQEAMARQGNRARRPPTITFRQVVVAPRPTMAERQRAYRTADSVRQAIEAGADFATMARRFSDDVTTRESGGDLGFFRRGMMVREFDAVAFNMRPGVVSPIVETTFGYHLIWVERVQAAEVKARHILFAPAVGEAELAAARTLGDSVAALVRRGADADSLARLYGDSSEERSVGPVDRTRMDSTYLRALADAAQGSVVGPFALNPEVPNRTRYVVAMVTDVQPERDYSFEEVRDQLRSGMLRDRGIRNLITDLRHRTHIDVRL